MIYLDYAASSPVLQRAAEEALRFMTDEYANPSSIHQAAYESRAVIDSARRRIAALLHGRPEEIIFTSGGTESDNLALFGAAGGRIRHVITTAVEHEAVLQSAKALTQEEGRTLTILKPDGRGRVSVAQVEEAIREILKEEKRRTEGSDSPEQTSGAMPSDTGILVSVMTANNEIGTIEPVKEIGAVCRKYGVLFHTDAVQAFGHIPIDVREMNIDLLSASGHKFGAPKGVGFLYASPRAGLRAMIHGGGQERRLRSGTLNTPGIAGLYEAVKYAADQMEASSQRIASLRDRFLSRVLLAIPEVEINSPLEASGLPEERKICLPGHLNLSFRGIEAESLLILLDMAGIAASAGSACASGALEPSHVLMALPGMTEERANASLRFSLGEYTTAEEIDETVRILAHSVEHLRKLRCGEA